MERKKPSKQNPFHKKVEKSSELQYPARLNKFVAKTGICSRRKAVDLIKAGLVSVNEAIQLEPFFLVEEGDQVALEGKMIKPETNFIYLLLNKPKDTISTTSDEKGRKTIFDIVDFEGKERLFPVGRLDRNTTGLILITNDGDLSKKLSHPSHKITKTYLVTLDNPISEEHFGQIAEGLTLEDGLAPVKTIHVISETRQEVEISIILGRNRIVRRIFESLGYNVLKLDRTYYGGLDKKGLPRGRYRPLTSREIIMLKHFT